jgi:hypothetical protein
LGCLDELRRLALTRQWISRAEYPGEDEPSQTVSSQYKPPRPPNGHTWPPTDPYINIPSRLGDQYASVNTATDLIPSNLHEEITRQAISARFATRTFRITGHPSLLVGNAGMFSAERMFVAGCRVGCFWRVWGSWLGLSEFPHVTDRTEKRTDKTEPTTTEVRGNTSFPQHDRCSCVSSIQCPSSGQE